MCSETEPSILLGFDHQLLIYPMNFMLPFLPIVTNHGTNLVAQSFCDKKVFFYLILYEMPFKRVDMSSNVAAVLRPRDR